MSHPTVSVIVPCFNQGHFLAAALESVAGQVLPADEVVLVDDGSTDDTATVAGRYPWVRYFFQPNLGLARARNAGLAATTGEFVVFLDADDRLRPDALQIGIDQLLAHPEAAFTFGRCQRIDERGEPLPTVAPPLISGDCYNDLLQSNSIWTPAIVMFRRAMCAPLMRFDPSVDPAADYDLYLRIARRFPVHGHRHVVAEYRLHGASMSRNPAVMFTSTMSVLRAQRSNLEPRHRAAYRKGLRAWRRWYGEQLIEQTTRYAHRPRRWRPLLAAMAILVRHYPAGVLAHLGRRVRRVTRRGERPQRAISTPERSR
jgi:glycosyltransferase involved in cell wall biosynthesis